MFRVPVIDFKKSLIIVFIRVRENEFDRESDLLTDLPRGLRWLIEALIAMTYLMTRSDLPHGRYRPSLKVSPR